MGHNLTWDRFCDECGRTINKAHRVHEGADYCVACYARVFISASCAQCGAAVRVHKFSTALVVCRQCVQRERCCLRCGKLTPRAGKMVNGRAVCPACVPHFVPEEPCERCAVPSSRLSRVPSLGVTERICPSCRSKLTHKTCAVCRKYRRVVGALSDGRFHCETCTPGSELSHACPSCGCHVAGKGNGRCRSCLNKDRMEKEISLQRLTLARVGVQDLYGRFGRWMYERNAANPFLLKKFRAQYPLFEYLDALPDDITQDLDGDRMMFVIGVDRLRKHLLIKKFLTEAVGISFDGHTQEAIAERARIERKFRAIRSSPYVTLLENYFDWLSQHGLPIRTVRLYLRAAEKLCDFYQISEQMQLTTKQVDKFLAKNSGSRASLSRFISYCGSVLGWTVSMPSKPKATKMPAMVATLKRLLAQVAAEGAENCKEDVLARIIAHLFGLRRHDLNNSVWSVMYQDQDIYMQRHNESFRVPPEAESVVEAWVGRRASKSRSA